MSKIISRLLVVSAFSLVLNMPLFAAGPSDEEREEHGMLPLHKTAPSLYRLSRFCGVDGYDSKNIIEIVNREVIKTINAESAILQLISVRQSLFALHGDGTVSEIVDGKRKTTNHIVEGEGGIHALASSGHHLYAADGNKVSKIVDGKTTETIDVGSFIHALAPRNNAIYVAHNGKISEIVDRKHKTINHKVEKFIDTLVPLRQYFYMAHDGKMSKIVNGKAKTIDIEGYIYALVPHKDVVYAGQNGKVRKIVNEAVTETINFGRIDQINSLVPLGQYLYAWTDNEMIEIAGGKVTKRVEMPSLIHVTVSPWHSQELMDMEKRMKKRTQQTQFSDVIFKLLDENIFITPKKQEQHKG